MLKRDFIIIGISWFFNASFVLSATKSKEVTEIVVKKSKRKLYLLSGNEIIRSYKVDLGFAPKGHKNFEGDGKTPEGAYKIDRKNENSKYYLSVGISYPNVKDQQFAKLKGKLPGGDIFIHGTRQTFSLVSKRLDSGMHCSK